MKHMKRFLGLLLAGAVLGSMTVSSASVAAEISESYTETAEMAEAGSAESEDTEPEVEETGKTEPETGETGKTEPETGETGIIEPETPEAEIIEPETAETTEAIEAETTESEVTETDQISESEFAVPEEYSDDPEYFKHQEGFNDYTTDIQTRAAVSQRKIKAYGIDVSQWQGDIDWQKVKASGVTFAIIRVGYRGQTTGKIFKDPYAEKNLKGAQAAGINIGAYFFSTAVSEEEALEEAKFTIDMIRDYRVTYPVVYDCEGYNNSAYRHYGQGKTKRTDYAVAFLKYIESQGYTPMMYGSKYSLTNDQEWETSRLEPLFNTWIAQYPTYKTETVKTEVVDENGETVEKEQTIYHQYPSYETVKGKQTTYIGKYTMWQFSSQGKIGGIYGNVDLDIEYYPEEQPVIDFVTRLYELVLGREPEESGLRAWTSVLTEQRESAAEVTYGFVFSDEFKKRQVSDEEYVKILYRTCLDREADAGGLAAWTDLLKGQFSRTYVLWGFIESQEFSKICRSYGIDRGNIGSDRLTENRDKNDQVTRFVRRCYNVFLDREPDVKGLNEWTGVILKNKEEARKVPYGFVFSKEMNDKKLSDEAFVAILYKGILDREPDNKGLSEWVKVLRNGKSREHVFQGFVQSKEFTELLAKYGL